MYLLPCCERGGTFNVHGLYPSLTTQRRKTILAERDSLILEFIEYYSLQGFDKPPYPAAKMSKFLETTKKLLNAIAHKTAKLKVCPHLRLMMLHLRFALIT
jgi:hypothetical protein